MRNLFRPAGKEGGGDEEIDAALRRNLAAHAELMRQIRRLLAERNGAGKAVEGSGE